MDNTFVLIGFLLNKYEAEKIWTLKASESNSIANLVAHISVHQRIETVFFNIPNTKDRDKEFDHGIQLSRG